jgi:hypothetical protein
MDGHAANDVSSTRSGAARGRNPDFLIIGAAKAGTTSLFQWLSSVPGVEMARQKELHYFCGQNSNRGLEWYRSWFPSSASSTGEATPDYTDPTIAEVVASRIHHVYPDISLIFLARDPIERTRSHYRHQVQRGRERVPFSVAADADSSYVATSMYSRALAPYLDRFPPSQLLILRSDHLMDESRIGWDSVLNFLRLPSHPRPADAYNQFAGKRQFSRPLLWLWDAGLLPRAESFPRWMRKLGKKVLTSDSTRYRHLIASSYDDLPEQSLTRLSEDRHRLANLLGRDIWADSDSRNMSAGDSRVV